MIGRRRVVPAIVLVIVFLLGVQNSPPSHSDPVVLSSSSVSIHLVGMISGGWNGTNPTITVSQGDIVSIILTSGDIDHQFAFDSDQDGAKPTGLCPQGDTCSKVFNAGTGTTFTFTASSAGTFAYFCTFHPNMVGSFIVKPLSTPPTVTITKLSPNPALTGTLVTLNFTITSSATVSGISIDWGDGTITHPSPSATSDTHGYPTTGNLRSQTFTINVTVTNTAGHGSGTTTETVNDRPPTVTVSSVSPNPGTTGQTVTVAFSATDPDGSVASFMVNWGDTSSSDSLPGTATSDTHSYSSVGSFTITVTATDNSGSNSQATGSARVQEPSLRTLTISSVSPNPADTGAPVIVTFTVSSATTMTGITVYWGDGSTLDRLSGSATSDTHSYSSTGNAKSQGFPITVTATNSAGPTFGTATETVNDRPPTVTASNVSPNPANIGRTVTIAFSATDADGTIASFSVNWGDGSAPDLKSASATSDTHSYTGAGSFTVTVTAIDNSGSSSSISSLPLSVTSPSGPGHHHHHHQHHHHSRESSGETHEATDVGQAPIQLENRTAPIRSLAEISQLVLIPALESAPTGARRN